MRSETSFIGLLKATPRAIWVLTAAFFALCITWSVLTPQFTAPDESAHVSSVIRMYEGFSWPDPGDAKRPAAVRAAAAERAIPQSDRSTYRELAAAAPGYSTTLDQMTQHPPLYYLIVGKTLAALHGEDLRWDRMLLTIRGLSALLALPLVWLIWSGVRMLTASPRAAIVAALVPFAIPQLAQITGVVNNDTAALLMGAIVAWFAIRVLVGDRRWPVLLGLGISLGIAGLTKATLISLVFLVAIVLLFGAGRPAPWGKRLWQTVWPLAVAIPAGMWWWAANLVRFGTLQPHGYTVGEVGWPPGTAPNALEFVSVLWDYLAGTFWGRLGQAITPLSEPLTDVLSVLCLFTIIAGAFQARRYRVASIAFTAGVAVSAALLIYVSWNAYLDSTEFRGMQGRYFFALLLPLIGLGVIGVLSLARSESARRMISRAVMIVCMAMPFVGLVVGFAGFYIAERGWREGFALWTVFVSPLNPVLTVAIPVVAGLLIVLGGTLSWREFSRVTRERALVVPSL
jgi:4-amino-4-deoxy-L-arabinose transferase-like glycosyltransferase